MLFVIVMVAVAGYFVMIIIKSWCFKRLYSAYPWSFIFPIALLVHSLSLMVSVTVMYGLPNMLSIAPLKPLLLDIAVRATGTFLLLTLVDFYALKSYLPKPEKGNILQTTIHANLIITLAIILPFLYFLVPDLRFIHGNN